MLKWAAIFLVIALIEALFGFTGIAAAAAGIAKFLFFLFLVICLIFFIIGISIGKKVTLPKLSSGHERSSATRVSPRENYFPFQGVQPARTFFSRSLHLSLTFVNASESPLRSN